LLITLLVLVIVPSQSRAAVTALPTTLKVSPAKIVVENGTSPLPASPITVSVTVLDVHDLFAWQTKLYFDSSVLNITQDQVWYPSDHVFAGKKFFEVTPTVSQDEKGAYVLFGASIQGEEPTFNGSGTLFQMNFTAVAKGASTLRLSTPIGTDTFLYDSSLNAILFVVKDGKEGSEISIMINPEEVTVAWFVNISGAVAPPKGIISVTIYYRQTGESSWFTLATVKTDMNGRYLYIWRTTQVGTYEIRTSWIGDENINGAISETKTARVSAVTPTFLYIAIIWAIAVTAVLIYFAKTRKHRQPPNLSLEIRTQSRVL